MNAKTGALVNGWRRDYREQRERAEAAEARVKILEQVLNPEQSHVINLVEVANTNLNRNLVERAEAAESRVKELEKENAQMSRDLGQIIAGPR